MCVFRHLFSFASSAGLHFIRYYNTVLSFPNARPRTASVARVCGRLPTISNSLQSLPFHSECVNFLFFLLLLVNKGWVFFSLPVSLRYFLLLLPPSGTMTCSDLAGTTVRKFYTTTVSKWVVLQTRFGLRKNRS